MTGVRPIVTLKRQQVEMLESFANEAIRVEAGAAVSSDPQRPAAMVGRVAEVVAEDETLGPHLLVVLQRFTGSPPAPQDANGESQVYYPWPGRSIQDFAEDERVLLVQVAGARLAGKG